MGVFQRFAGLVKSATQALYPVDNRGGGWFSLTAGRVREPFAGAWQRNIEYNDDQLLAFFAVFACITRIAQDISKVAFVLRTKDPITGIFTPADNPAFCPVLARPNAFQNHIQFKESWLLSKLHRGNAYVFKERDARNVVVGLVVLHPDRVQPLVTIAGDVYYRLMADNLSGVAEGGVVVPASEIIHDRCNTLFHPLVGISPLFASACATNNGLRIQENSARFFANGSVPGGLLMYPGELPQTDADELKAYWSANYTGENAGKIAVLTGGMTYQALRMTATDSQLIEQLKMTGEVVCSCFHVPPYKVGIGAMPTQTNIEALDIQYVGECLQFHIESMEACLDDALGIGAANRSQFDVALDTDGLARMDSTNQSITESNLVKAGIKAPNEARKRFNLPPVKGGDTPYLQQQQYSLAALGDRDADKPFAKPTPAPAPSPVGGDGTPPPDRAANDDVAAGLLAHIAKELAA